MNATPRSLQHEDFALRHLRLPTESLAACDAAGIITVRDLDAAPVGALPDEVRSAADDAVAALRQVELPRLPAVDLDRAVLDVTTCRRAKRACAELGLRSIGEFLACPAQRLLALEGFGARSWQRVIDRISITAASRSFELDWLPDSLLAAPLAELGLRGDARTAVRASSARTVGDLLHGFGPRDERSRETIRSALRRALRFHGSDRRGFDEPFPALLRRVRRHLSEVDRRLFDAIVGIGRRPSSPQRACVLLRLPHDEAEPRTRALRATLLEVAGDALEAFAADATTDLLAHEGVVGVEELAVGTALRAAAHVSPEPTLPLRLLAFVFDDRWSFEGERLCALPPDAMRSLVRATRAVLAGARPPVRVAEVAAAVGDGQVPTALLLHVLRRVLGHAVSLQAEHGEVVVRRRSSIAARLEALLDDADAPLPLDDVLFRYRDRHHRSSRRRIADALRAGGAFLEIGAGLWSLRSRHVDELELLRPEAERIAAALMTQSTRHSVRDGVRRGDVSERSAFLLADLLRREPGIRDLGRGEFIARRREGSTLVAEITRELRRAMGEIPFARFLQNQPPARRRLVSRVLRSNRLFVSPSRDRVDLLENYPYGGDRLQMLLREVSICVEERGGYAALRHLRSAVVAAELGGDFLSDHMLFDLLRRHGRFELLPGGWIAAPGVALGRWIQRTARSILRSQLTSLSSEQILAARPELAEFADCLIELLEQDPLVQSEDGLHYQLV